MMRPNRRCALYLGLHHVELREFEASDWLHRTERLTRNARCDMPALTDLPAILHRLFAEIENSARQVSVVISDAWCKSLVAPRLQGAANVGEAESALRMRFQRESGEDDLPRTLKLHMAAFAQKDLAVGIPSQMLEMLEAAAVTAGISLCSIQPLWVACAEENQFPGRKDYAWLLVADGDSCTLALFQGNACQGVRTFRRKAAQLTSRQLIAREGALFDVSAEVATCFAWGEPLAADRPQAGDIQFVQHAWPHSWAGKGCVTRKGRVE